MNADKNFQWPASLFVVDTETTGLDAHRHGLLEVAVLHLASEATRTWLVMPDHGSEWEAAALRVNGLTPEILTELPRVTPSQMAWELMRWIRNRSGGAQAVVVGKNPTFDRAFLDAAATGLAPQERAFFELTFRRRMLDVHSAMMGIALANGVSIDTDKIEDLWRFVGVAPEEKPHTALRGAQHAALCLRTVVERVIVEDAP